MSTYLLEVGTEELPYKFIPQAIEQLNRGFKTFLNDNKVKYSDIKVYADYTTAFTIEENTLKTSISDDATVNISYDTRDITVSSVDITSFTTSENKSIFGSAYKPDQVAAFEQIARNTIVEKVNTEENLNLAKNNLENHLKSLAQDFNVKINITQN